MTTSPRTFRRTLICRNPECRREFTPDADHRFGGCCCALCAKAVTLTPTEHRRYSPPNVSMSVLNKPAIVRRPGRDNRE